MHEIKCPHCQKAFTIDEAGYANIAQQVRDSEFDKQLQQQVALAEQEKRKALELAQVKAANELQQAATAKENEIQELKAKLDAFELKQKLAVNEALTEAEKQLATKNTEIQELKAKIENSAAAKQLEIAQAVTAVEKERDALKSGLERERDELKNGLEKIQLEKQLAEQSLKDKYETQIKDRDDAIERLRDMKAKLSTKMVGESLEQHCEIEFNKIRSTAFPRAYFEKDNDARSGSKGDFIFRDHSEAGTEIVSIMFEMKNESDTTATKKKNEDFLAELHKDRTEKGCEYAVLVSMLESDNELFNTGIVDMSHRHEKMYVIRPQFFIPMITLLRNSSMKALDFKNELELIKAHNIDVTNFESELESFKSNFGRNYDIASRKFQDAIKEIDKSIAALQKTKDALLGTENQLRLANNKAQEVSIKRLTRSNPTMALRFAELTITSTSSSD